MTTIEEQIRNSEQAICQNINLLSDNRELLSQNILAQLRNLTEGVAVALHAGRVDSEFQYDRISTALKFVRADGKTNFVTRFHKLLQTSASHYSLEGDPSERLMLKYYEQLFLIRNLVQDQFGMHILANLESFPIDLNPSLREYHTKIAERVQAAVPQLDSERRRTRYYIHRKRPFFVEGRIYYEVTFYPAINRANKSDRIIGFTSINLNHEYSAYLDLGQDNITVFGQSMPVTIIQGWAVSIRPCEFQNFARLFGLHDRVLAGTPEYRYLMQWLTATSGNLLDLMDLSDDHYAAIRAKSIANVATPHIFPAMDAARALVRVGSPGSNIIRYLMLRMRNEVLKAQHNWEPCKRLSNLQLKWGCIPFDVMPFCSSLVKHNPRYWDLIESIGIIDRTHELLARRVKSNVEQRGQLYTPVTDVEAFGDLPGLVSAYNDRLYYKHRPDRDLRLELGQVFIRSYEDTTVSIIEKLQGLAASGVASYTENVERWLAAHPERVDDHAKRDAIKRLYSQSHSALVYGAAGTGKSTMVDHIAAFYEKERKLFLAHTHPAVSNLQRRVTANNATFRTIASHNRRRNLDTDFDVLFIDECSTVDNDALLEVLTKTTFRLLVLVGDAFQIESVQFGNWFGISPAFIPASAVFELTTPYRTKNKDLLALWDKVRHIDNDVAEVMARHGYSTDLDESLFRAERTDEIILCLNYDGLYGINNINRFLQAGNPSPAIRWGAAVYKVGDPVLFHEAERFKPVIHNNLKGRIVAIEPFDDSIEFSVRLDREVEDWEINQTELILVDVNTVQFSVVNRDASDEDDDSLNTTVPFQVAYAVSIHKAQGLEYDSVKVVITDANEDNITHSIFYTAITRAREHLRVYWTPETQQAVLAGLTNEASSRDVELLSRRRGLRPVGAAQR